MDEPAAGLPSSVAGAGRSEGRGARAGGAGRRAARAMTGNAGEWCLMESDRVFTELIKGFGESQGGSPGPVAGYGKRPGWAQETLLCGSGRLASERGDSRTLESGRRGKGGVSAPASRVSVAI